MSHEAARGARSGSAIFEAPADSDRGYESVWTTSPSGCRLHLRKWGSGRQACLLIHGHGEGSYVWNLLIPYLRGFTVFAIDLPGHGDSGREPDGRYEIARYVQDVSSALAALRLKGVALVGHSLGASVAMRIAALNRAVSKLALVDFGPRVDERIRQHAREQFKSQFQVYAQMSDYADSLSATRPLLSPRVVLELTRGVLRERADGAFELKCDPALAHDENRLESSDQEILSFLEKIRCPTLIVRGAGSAVLSPSSAALVTKTLHDGRLCTIARAGHAVMTDNPEDFGTALFRFLHSG